VLNEGYKSHHEVSSISTPTFFMSGPNHIPNTLIYILVTYVKDDGKIFPVLKLQHIKIEDLNPYITAMLE
jgi:hypothetical protein